MTDRLLAPRHVTIAQARALQQEGEWRHRTTGEVAGPEVVAQIERDLRSDDPIAAAMATKLWHFRAAWMIHFTPDRLYHPLDLSVGHAIATPV